MPDETNAPVTPEEATDRYLEHAELEELAEAGDEEARVVLGWPDDGSDGYDVGLPEEPVELEDEVDDEVEEARQTLGGPRLPASVRHGGPESVYVGDTVLIASGGYDELDAGEVRLVRSNGAVTLRDGRRLLRGEYRLA